MDGNQRAKYLYRPFGGMHLEVDNNNNVTWDHFATTYRYAAYKEDQESNLFYLNARYFDAEIGQFLTVDPAEAGLNHYGYVTNPIAFSDPTGLDYCDYFSNTGGPPTIVHDTPPDGDGNGGGYNGGGGNTPALKPAQIIQNSIDTLRGVLNNYGVDVDLPPADDIQELNWSYTILDGELADWAVNVKTKPKNTEPGTSSSNTPSVNSTPPSPANIILNNVLDGAQMALGTLGFIPGIGEIPDGINGLISLGRGDYLGAGLSLAAMIPFVGWVSGAGKIGRNGLSLGSRVAKKYTVYALQDSATGAVKYVGRTTNPVARALQHASSVEKGGLDFVRLNEGLTYKQARGLEQLYFNKYAGFDRLLNKINPISPTNPNLPFYIKAAKGVR